jgi:hypothetical protein
MAENDVFNRNGKPGWRKASRQAMMENFDEVSLLSILKALRTELKKSEIPGFRDLVTIVDETASDPISDEALLGSFRRLDRVRRENGCANTETAVSACKGYVSQQLSFSGKDEREVNRRAVDLSVSVRILSDVTISWLFPLPVLNELSEMHGLDAIIRRQEQIGVMLCQSKVVGELALALWRSPSGSSPRLPRPPRLRISQEKLLETNLLISAEN